jgi:hypothetical protein
VHDDAPVLFQSRWALSYLRGPLTGPEISRLMADRKAAARLANAGTATSTPDQPRASGTQSPPTAATQAASAATSRPVLPAGVAEYFLPATVGDGEILYKPMVMGLGKLHFIDSKLALDQWRTNAYLAPLSDDGAEALWPEATVSADLKSRASKAPASNASFAALPGAAMRASSYAAWNKSLSAYLYENARADVLLCPALKATSAPDESEGDFRSRLALAARERRDAAVAALRTKYAPKLQTLDNRERAAQDRVSREQSQLSQQKLQTAFSIGASILGAFLGRKALSATNINRAASAARSASRIGRESGDVDRADESLEGVRQQRADLQRQFEAETAALESSLDASAAPVTKVQVSPRKSDIAVGEVALVWAPWRKGADGFPAPAFTP